MDDFPYVFDAPIVPMDFGKYAYSVVFLPEDLQAELPFDQHPRLRVNAVIGPLQFSASWTPANGRRYILLSKKRLKKLGVEVGDWVTVAFAIADQSAVDIPEPLQQALEDHPEAQAIWQQMSPGKRRSLAYQVASAKRESTQQKRVQAVIDQLLNWLP